MIRRSFFSRRAGNRDCATRHCKWAPPVFLKNHAIRRRCCAPYAAHWPATIESLVSVSLGSRTKIWLMKRILLVDDDHRIALALGTRLRATGYEVLTAPDPA